MNFSWKKNYNIISNKYAGQITDLIDLERMTAGGYGKAGTKYLESLSEEELMAYSSDIERASQYIQLEKIQLKYEIDAIDMESLLWKLFSEAMDRGLPFDSDQVKEAADGNVDTMSFIIELDKYISNKNYGAADFQDWFDAQKGLE